MEIQFRFIKGLISNDNLQFIEAWIKNTSVRFYDIEYAWRKGEHPTRGLFSPDFFIKLTQQPITLIVEIKDDTEIGEPAEENPAKYKYAREHFERINTNLKKSDEKMYYQFNFLTPIDYTVFFQNMRQGEIKDFQSNLDIRLMEKL